MSCTAAVLHPLLCGCASTTPTPTNVASLTKDVPPKHLMSTNVPSVLLADPPAPTQPIPPPNSPQRRPPPTGPRIKVEKKRGPKTPWKPTVAKRTAAEIEQERVLELVETDPALLLKLLEPTLAKLSFAEFFRQAWKELEPGTELVWNWHIDLICTVMQAVFMDWLRAKRDRKPGKYRYANKVRNIDLNVPPGSSKSAILARSFQAWCWLHIPAMKFLALSVNDDATMRDARATRELIRTKWYLDAFKPSWKIKSDQDAISNFGNNSGGDRISMPIKSEIVGLRSDCLIVDDANNPKKVHNKAERDEINELWDTTIFNRVNDLQRSLRIGIQQRTHVLDWTGHIIETQGLWNDGTVCDAKGNLIVGKDGKPVVNLDGWLHVVIPAEFEAERKFVMPQYLRDVLEHPLEGFEGLTTLRDAGVIKFLYEDPRTIEGESIDEVRMPRSVLEGERRRWSKSGSYAGQMQQRPALADGAMINRGWWGFCRLAGGVREEIDGLDNNRPRPAHCHPRPLFPGDPEGMEAQVIHGATHRPNRWDFDWVVISLDPATKKTDKGSNWGLLVVAGKGGRRYVLDDRTQRGALHEILDIMVELAHTWEPDTILIESKVAGPSVMDSLRERMGKGDVPMITIEEIDPGNSDKEVRLDAVLSYFKNGMVYLLDGATWLEEFVNEMSLFPAGARDDRVDALTQVLDWKRAADDEWPTF